MKIIAYKFRLTTRGEVVRGGNGKTPGEELYKYEVATRLLDADPTGKRFMDEVRRQAESYLFDNWLGGDYAIFCGTRYVTFVCGPESEYAEG